MDRVVKRLVRRQDSRQTITIETLDANDQVVFSTVVHDVPFKRNRITKLQGSLFSSSVASAIQVETAWENEEVVNF